VRERIGTLFMFVPRRAKRSRLKSNDARAVDTARQEVRLAGPSVSRISVFRRRDFCAGDGSRQRPFGPLVFAQGRRTMTPRCDTKYVEVLPSEDRLIVETSKFLIWLRPPPRKLN
jgi:hypothetical protein